jgi:hypothetical protein
VITPVIGDDELAIIQRVAVPGRHRHVGFAVERELEPRGDRDGNAVEHERDGEGAGGRLGRRDEVPRGADPVGANGRTGRGVVEADLGSVVGVCAVNSVTLPAGYVWDSLLAPAPARSDR